MLSSLNFCKPAESGRKDRYVLMEHTRLVNVCFCDLCHFRIKVATAVMAEKCDVTICRDSTGSPQTFTLRPGGVLRIGRGVANDVVLDFDGVSVYHAEIHLPKDGPLCIRDESRNGTAVRPGPHAAEKGATAWEPLKKSQLRILPHGWQILMPLNSRRNTKQLVVSARLLSIFMGTKVPPMPGQEPAAFPLRTHKVFSAGRAAVHRNVKPLPAVKMEEAEEPDLQLKRKKKRVEGSDAEPSKRKKKKKDKRRKHAGEEDADEEVAKRKKGKTRVKEQESEDLEETEAQRKEREERERLERELEDELAEETRKVHRQVQPDPADSANFDGSATYRDAESSMHPATEVPEDDEDEADEADDAETQRALQKAMGASEAEAEEESREDQENREDETLAEPEKAAEEVDKEPGNVEELQKEPDTGKEADGAAEQDVAALLGVLYQVFVMLATSVQCCSTQDGESMRPSHVVSTQVNVRGGLCGHFPTEVASSLLTLERVKT